MTEQAAWYDLHGVTLCQRLEGLDGKQAAATGLDWLIGERRMPAGGTLPVATMTVRRAGGGTLCLPPGMSERPTSDMGRLLKGTDADGHPVLVHGDTVKLVLLPGGDAVADLADNADSAAIGDAMVHALDHALSSNGHCLLHAASLVTPDGTGMVLVHARSGTGKTTTAMALALAGFRLSGDDTAVLARGPDGAVTAWGLPRWAKVHRQTVALLPPLAALADPGGWDRHGEQMIARRALMEQGLVSPGGPLPVRAVISLVRGDGSRDITEVDRFEAIRSLLEDNVSGGPDGFHPGHEARFDLFASMVNGCRRLRVPVHGGPDAIAAAIARMLGY